jgi:hypothetical protein
MRSIDGWGVLPPQTPWRRKGGAITPHPALRADLPLKGGGAFRKAAARIENPKRRHFARLRRIRLLGKISGDKPQAGGDIFRPARGEIGTDPA